MRTIGRAKVIDSREKRSRTSIAQERVQHSFRQFRSAIHLLFLPAMGDALCFRLNDISSLLLPRTGVFFKTQ
jgi:hypothetical protein